MNWFRPDPCFCPSPWMAREAPYAPWKGRNMLEPMELVAELEEGVELSISSILVENLKREKLLITISRLQST